MLTKRQPRPPLAGGGASAGGGRQLSVCEVLILSSLSPLLASLPHGLLEATGHTGAI